MHIDSKRNTRKPIAGLVLLGAAAAVALPVALAQGAASSPPTVATSPATNVTDSGATSHGTVNPNGQQTSYAFQWGETGGYGHETPLTSAGSGSSPSSVNAALNGLAPGSSYHFRIIAINQSGTSVGSDQGFTTTGIAPTRSPSPTATTGSASGVAQSTATLTGNVNPHSQATAYYFEYGPTANYGFQTAARSAGSGVGDEPVSMALSGVSPNTTYHYRLVAVNAGGTALGGDQAFTTAGPTLAPSHVAFMGHMGFVSPGGIVGVEAGCFGGQTGCGGHITMSHDGSVIGQRNFYIAPASGGFQILGINALGKQLLRHNGVWNLLPVDVDVTTVGGPETSQVMYLARWVWH